MASVHVVEGQDAEVVSDDGQLSVVIAGDAIGGEGLLSVTPTDAAGSDGHGPAGWVVEMSDGAELVGEATLRFNDAAPTDGAAPAPVAAWSREPGGKLAAAPTQVDGDDVVVRTEHFSFWTLFDWQTVLGDVVDRLALYDEAPQPRCAGEKAVRDDGWKVTSDSGNRVKWCFGEDDAALVLRVTNSRGYAVALEVTPGLRNTSVSPFDVVVEALLGLAFERPSKAGNTVAWVGPGETADLVITEARALGARAQPSVPAYLMSAAWYAVETLVFVLDRVGVSRSRSSIVTALKLSTCVRGLASMTSADIATPQQAADYLTNAVSTTLGCAGDAAEDLGLGLMGPVIDALLWVLNGVRTAAQGFVAAADTAAAPDGYSIVATPPPGAGRDVRVRRGGVAAFASPSGNIVCHLSEDDVRCLVRESNWEPPPNPADCPLQYGPDANFEGFMCVGDTSIYSAALDLETYGATSWHTRRDPVVRDPVVGRMAGLAYGSRVSNGLVECAVEEAGVTCRRFADGATLFLSRDRIDFD